MKDVLNEPAYVDVVDNPFVILAFTRLYDITLPS